ncbi:uncharacterized protein [Epargyreus clarus]|uniref:uncharacterized protein isoform X2 n=1 Tax=Epargyreus clarus TaxID=520877 RepID=UPI003C2D2ED5
MKVAAKHLRRVWSVLFCIQMSGQVFGGTQFTSHVSVNTPARSFSHGVGDPLPLRRHAYQQQGSFRQLRRPATSQTQGGSRGYPKEKPSTPFRNEDIPQINIPVLPPSPYKVDSPDPESLWPDGLFLPPINPPRFEAHRRSDSGNPEGLDPLDPYLLEGSEAISAVRKASLHGHLYFHDIPHIKSLLDNQELRTKNKLKPHRIGSIRHTWPYNRP